MKYAFVMGSNAFIVPCGSISYNDNVNGKEFLKINSVYHDVKSHDIGPALDIDLDIKDTDGTPVIILANKPVTGAPYSIRKKRDNIQVLRIDGSLIIQVHQLDDESAMSLEHNITAELEVHSPLAVIRISGEFMVGGLHVSAENEKLFVNGTGYATSAMVGKRELRFTPAGVVL